MRSWIALPLAGGALVALGLLAWWKHAPVPPHHPSLTSVTAPAALPATPVPSSTTAQSPAPASAPIAADRFREWTARYLAATTAERTALESEGVALARARRPVLAALIRQDPAVALASAVPTTVRTLLPAPIQSLLEERLSGTGELSLRISDPPAGSHANSTVTRTALLGRREFRAFVFGRRATQATLGRTALHGIALDGDAAFAEAPWRALEAGESLPSIVHELPGADKPHPALAAVTYVEAAGETYRVCCEPHLAALTESLLALEENHATVTATDAPGSSGVTLRPDAAWTHGPRSLLVIRVDFSDLPGTPIFGVQTVDEDFASKVITDTGGVRDFYAACSFGQTSITFRSAVRGDSPDVTPVLRLPRTAVEYASKDQSALLHSDARDAAVAAGFPVGTYDRVGVVFSALQNVAGSKFYWAGLADLAGKNFCANGEFSFRVVAHELGHTYGLVHANSWTVSDGNPASPNGSAKEYGDFFDVMGFGLGAEAHFNQWEKNLLQWLPDAAIAAPAVDGVYRIHRFDAAGADLSRNFALKLPHTSMQDYWLGYRRGLNNPSFNGGIYGLLCGRTNLAGALVDFGTPGTNLDDAGLLIGNVHTDTAAGVAFQPIAQGGSGDTEWLDVQVDFAPFQPQVRWSRSQWFFDEGSGTAVLTLQRSATSAGAVSVAYTTTPGTAVAPANFAPLAGRVTWADGDTSDKTVIVALTPDTAREGLETFTVTLSDPVGAMITGGPLATVTITEPGTRDPAFQASYTTRLLRRIVPLADGTFLVAGAFTNAPSTVASDVYRRGLTRLRANGTVIPGFAGGVGAFAVEGPIGSPGAVYDFALQSDGKIVVGGDFTSFTGTPRARILRLNADGTLDPGFNPGSGANGTVHAVRVQPDGKVLLGGEFTAVGGSARRYVARLNSDGSPDADFAAPEFMEITGGHVAALALQPDGRILVGGKFAFTGSPARSGLCRLRADGSLDPEFGDLRDGAHTAGNAADFRTVNAITLDLDGRVLVGGDFTAFNGTARRGIARLTASGASDITFSPSLDGVCQALVVQSDGRIVVGGAFTQVNGTALKNLARLTADGTTDPGFYAGDYAGAVTSLATLPDGRLVFGGESAGFQDSTFARSAWAIFATSNFAPAILTGPRPRTVGVGAEARFAVNAAGTPPLSYQWFRDGTPLPGATSPELFFAAVQTANAGNYTVRVQNARGTVVSEAARLDVRPRALRLVGISTRALVGTDSSILIGGFAISGTTPKRVAIRANGPALRAYGVTDALPDPVLSLYSGQTLIQQNDNWSAADAAELTALGMAAWTAGSADSAIITTLAPGAYTAQVSGKPGWSGIALLEIYDAEPDTAVGRLTGISARADVSYGNALLIGGFAITGDVPKRVLVRAAGPALAPYGVSPVLGNPVLTIFSGQTVIATNDDWSADLAGDFAAAGMFAWAAGSKDAALSLTLPPGAYTAQVSGNGGAIGIALIEIYED